VRGLVVDEGGVDELFSEVELALRVELFQSVTNHSPRRLPSRRLLRW
jgi:hypothetical protein